MTSETKRNLLYKMHEDKVDFRNLSLFKNILFDCEELRDNHLIPISHWKEHMKMQMLS
jgi:arginine utilization protein RocB